MLQMSYTHEETFMLVYTCNICAKKFKVTGYMKKHKQKKAHTLDIKVSDYLYKNPKLPKIVLSFSNQPQRFTPPY